MGELLELVLPLQPEEVDPKHMNVFKVHINCNLRLRIQLLSEH
jgi:hypothetical protein